MSAWRWFESVCLQLPLRLIVGGAFLVAAWMKLFHRTWAGADPTFDFAESIAAYKILDPARHEHVIAISAYMMPWAELLGGLLVVLGLWTRSAALLVAVLLAMFTAANLSVVLRPEISASCACFGSIDWPCGGTEVSWCQVWRNLVLLVMAAYLVWRGGGLMGLDRAEPRLDASGERA